MANRQLQKYFVPPPVSFFFLRLFPSKALEEFDCYIVTRKLFFLFPPFPTEFPLVASLGVSPVLGPPSIKKLSVFFLQIFLLCCSTANWPEILPYLSPLDSSLPI